MQTEHTLSMHPVKKKNTHTCMYVYIFSICEMSINMQHTIISQPTSVIEGLNDSKKGSIDWSDVFNVLFHVAVLDISLSRNSNNNFRDCAASFKISSLVSSVSDNFESHYAHLQSQTE
jgi:hypothetical protein